MWSIVLTTLKINEAAGVDELKVKTTLNFELDGLPFLFFISRQLFALEYYRVST